ncbi:MAG: CHAT domain-containing protein, partial [Acidobacteria bacterium]|nr:CHAT domain-containing protein [Acidobacteriota bacterium]
YAVLHIATHGQFSSNAANTFILAWDRPINVSELGQMLQSEANSPQPIELLVLSACQTAVGDRRAALGMAVGRGVRDPVEKTRIATTRDVLVGIVSPSFERTGADAPAPRPRRGPKPRSDWSRRRRRS